MPRPQRCRKICNKPAFTTFSADKGKDDKIITLTLDEFEVIRLLDAEGQTHEQCAKQMEISRTTVTEIYMSARHKIAESIVHGYHLIIDGGNYRLCDGHSTWCYKEHCKKQKPIRQKHSKGETTMRIAVTYENGEIFQHFGHTEEFKIYDVEDGKIISSQIVSSNGNGHSLLADLLFGNEVDILICGGIGGGAQNALAAAGIKLYGGVSGSADEAVNALLAGTLSFNAAVHCSHHDHEQEGNAHTCGEHGCGKGSCH